MSDDVKPELIKREHKFARTTFSIAVTAVVSLGAYELIHWLANLHR
jgi:hypothetical protein